VPPAAATPPTLSCPAPFKTAKVHGVASEHVPVARFWRTYPPVVPGTNVGAVAVPVNVAPVVTWKVPVPEAVVFVSVNVSTAIIDGVTFCTLGLVIVIVAVTTTAHSAPELTPGIDAGVILVLVKPVEPLAPAL